MDFKNIDKKYRPVPFWSWNEKLNVEESLRQTAVMDEAGMGGYFMHARGGLQTKYMGEEWFENVSACIEECNKRGMHAWAYDENGWPSGFGGGKVNGKGEKYWQKYLRYMPADADRSAIPAHRIIKVTPTHCFYYETNEFYVDTLDEEVIADFINEIYVPYYEKYGDSFDGFFTDEPQISRNGIPWSLTLENEYRRAYGEELADVLLCLFEECGSYADVRVKFWRLVTELFSKNFMKQIYDWCESHNLKFTGHLVLEETLTSQLITNGACMPHYEYLSIPGMDWLGRNIRPCLTHHQVGSAAAQTGHNQIISETFALCGHNVGHDELKRNYEWMMVRGINLMCQHLEGYSLRGIRKRDYPPAMYVQQPWWSDYKVFNDAMSRVGMILCEGEIKFDTLLMHNMTSAWICFNNGTNKAVDGKDIEYYNKKLIDATLALEAKHIPFHLGDEILMERHGRVEGNKLIIGQMTYTKVVIPEHIRFMENTEKLLAEFRANGGVVVTVEELEANDVIDNEKITYTWRDLGDSTVHYFVNSNNSWEKAKITRGSYAIDIATGEKMEFTGEYNFPPCGSLLIVDDGTPASPKKPEKELKTLDISGKWHIDDITYNSLTLDKCDYYFDGELQEENGYVLNILQRTTDLKRPVDLLCRYKVNVDYISEHLYLALETPEIFTVKVNGVEVDKTDCGYFRDKSFRMINIRDHAKLGENVIEVSTVCRQSREVYENIEKSGVFESEKNKLTYDMEIEAMYLVGDFAVRANGEFELIKPKLLYDENFEIVKLEGEIENDDRTQRAYFFDGSFTLVKPESEIEPRDLEQNGYTFFSGEMKLSKTFKLDSTDYKLVFNKYGFNALRIRVNGIDLDTIMWAPYSVDLSDYLKVGENKIELTMVNNLRNLLGPLHHKDGEILAVCPFSFYKEPSFWTNFRSGWYTDKYCFVNMGLL